MEQPESIEQRPSSSSSILKELQKNYLSIVFLVTCLIVFAVAQLSDPENVRFLAFDYDELPDRWWAFVTYGFVHVDWNHIIVNMLVLVWLGVWVERLLTPFKYCIVVFVSILAGSAALFVRKTAGIGFSAAAAGFIFYYNCAFPMERELVWKIPNITVPIIVAVVSIGSIIFGWFPGVGHWPHLTGGLAGLFFLAIFRKSHKSLEDDTPELPTTSN
ncbi:hypothetical protein GEMRC1_004113 [Eukaryota sp. GEM-RC1]